MIKKLFLLSISLLTAFTVNAAPSPLPVQENEQNFLGGFGQVNFAMPFSDSIAGSLGLEGGNRHGRVNATLGWAFLPNQRIKLTGEYLRQNIDYTFLTGTTRQWVNQRAAGLDYEYAFNTADCPDFFNYFDLSGYYSHAPSIDLSPISGSYNDDLGNTIDYTNIRRIAGSDAYGITPAIVVHPWWGGKASFGLNYDDVKYDNIYSQQVTAEGIGETIKLSQDLGNNFQLNLLASNRKPFDNYQAGIMWTQPVNNANLTWGVLGSYTKGKAQLPNTSYAGISVSYVLQNNRQSACKMSNNTYPSLASWTSKPAVYMPQVLAIVDQKLLTTITPKPVPPVCVAPKFSGEIPEYTSDVDGNIAISTGSYFTGTNLVYSLYINPNDTQGKVQINSTTGQLTGNLTGTSEQHRAVVTATNVCGSIHSNEIVIFRD